MTTISDAIHLWRGAAFGAQGDVLQRTVAQGYETTVSELLQWDAAPGTEPPPATLVPPGIALTLVQVAALVGWWMNEMATTPHPLREKMVLFWHGHFTTSVVPVFSPGLLLRQNQTFRQHAAGRFEDILLAVATDPAMLVYLDGRENRKAHPNENFAREVMELFTLGIGHYTERDVKEVARALTGWKLGGLDGHAVFHPELHDDGVKHVLGHVGRFGLEDVVHIVATHPATARRVTGRLFRFLTGLDAPSQEADRLAATFTRTHGDMGAVLRTLLLGDAFRRARHGCRSPIEWLVNAMRVLDLRFEWLAWIDPLRVMGQLPFLPPSVKGWDDGPAWINTATLLDRVNFAARLSERPHAGLVSLVDQTTARTAVRGLLWALGMGDVRPATAARLEQVWTASQPEGPARTAQRLLTLALASPEFQMK